MTAASPVQGGGWPEGIADRSPRATALAHKPRLSPAEWALLAGLAGWALAPVVVMAVHALLTHQRLTGADGLIGADQLQYLAWARDAGRHGLASNLFQFGRSAHVFAQPLFTVSGGLWRLGIPLPLAYLLWKPVAVVVLFAGAAAWTARLFPRQPGARVCALALSLLLYTPVAGVEAWTGSASQTAGGVLQLAGEMFPAGMLWGYLPTAIAVGLMPITLLAVERALLRQDDTSARGALTLAAASALLVSWLHPWEGIILLLILAGLAIWARLRCWWLYALPALGGLLPLVYYGLLSRLDTDWRLAAHSELVPRLPWGAIALGLVPLLIVAGAGVHRSAREPSERALLLWVPASLLTYLVVDAFPAHAWASVSLPLSVLAVRGWKRLRLPAVASVVAVVVITLPGAAAAIRGFVRIGSNRAQEYYLSRSDSRALDWVASRAPAGGVLAKPLPAITVPSQTGRAVWVGHQFWSRDYLPRARAADALFGGRLSSGQARALVAGSGARLLFADCSTRADLAALLKPLLAAAHRFGCATVWVMRRH